MAKPGIENVEPHKIDSTEKARALGSIGGKKSGEAKRRRKAMKEAFEVLLSMPQSGVRAEDIDGLDFKSVERLKTLSMNDKIAAAVVKKAAKGDVQAAAFIRDTIGEKPVEKLEVSADVEKAAREIDDLIAQWSGEQDGSG
ncbi:MAG: hypothetical protein SOW20_08115 [Berryella intestinalis]|uniref:hypothetical protein n=1 Tax=Berryella intestinalis TaxID=1531429 RepID=UPI002A75A4DE|nr:hypothetical protein [Berryella intestinalis]MDY3129968.1 hypothetical protein [Berryella intestinalis]